MLERTQLQYVVEQLRTDFAEIVGGLARTEDNVWQESPLGHFIGLSHVSRDISSCNEDRPYRDINTPESFNFTESPKDINGLALARSLSGTHTEKVYQAIQGITETPFSAGRMRYVRVPAYTTQPLHRDIGFSYYVAIEANPLAMFVTNGGDGLPKRVNEGNLPMVRVYTLSEDGRAYIVDGNRFYTIANAGNADAYFLQIETNRVHRERPDWTGLTIERMTGHNNVLDGDLPDSTIFKSVDL